MSYHKIVVNERTKMTKNNISKVTNVQHGIWEVVLRHADGTKEKQSYIGWSKVVKAAKAIYNENPESYKNYSGNRTLDF